MTPVLTTMSNVSLTDRLVVSVAVSLTESVPTSVDVGVPEKVLLPASKESQVAESAESSALVAVYTGVSPTSANVFAGNV